jgi:hypothetical protein
VKFKSAPPEVAIDEAVRPEIVRAPEVEVKFRAPVLVPDPPVALPPAKVNVPPTAVVVPDSSPAVNDKPAPVPVAADEVPGLMAIAVALEAPVVVMSGA